MTHKTELITLRIPCDVKSLLDQNAHALNISINDYVKNLILEDAKKTLRESFMSLDNETEA